MKGTVFISVAARDRKAIIPIARRLAAMGFRLLCTGGTAQTMNEHGIKVEVVRKIHEGRPNVLDYLANGTIDLIVNTPERQRGTDRRRTDPCQCRLAWRALYHDTGWWPVRPLPPWNACGPASSRFMHLQDLLQIKRKRLPSEPSS